MRPASAGPWKLFAAMIATGLVLVALFRLFPTAFEHSTPRLSFEKDAVVVEFDAINHTPRPMTRTLGVSIGSYNPGSKASPPGYRISDFQAATVSLAASESRHLRCRFRDQATTPNNAEVAVMK